jgi:2-polyprenyl-3-methyl-5-hydroxy-6-metoxy-1,4-benzoquinol methylase
VSENNVSYLEFENDCCPICSSLEQEDVTGSDEITYLKCASCSLIWQYVLPDSPGDIYSREEYDEVRRKNSQTGSWARFHHDRGVANLRFSQFRGVPNPGKSKRSLVWVDYGCGNGAMLVEARKRGYIVSGVELSKSTATETWNLVSVPVYQDIDPLMDPDVISFFDVLEHMIDPVGTLKRCGEALNNGGVIIIESPNVGDYDGPLEKFKHYRPYEHLYHFSDKSLDALRKWHLQDFKSVHVCVPIENKIQVVWQKQPAKKKGRK